MFSYFRFLTNSSGLHVADFISTAAYQLELQALIQDLPGWPRPASYMDLILKI